MLTSLTTVKNEIWEKQENWPWCFFLKKNVKEQEYWTTSECSGTCWKYILYMLQSKHSCFSTYSTWVVFVISRLLPLCVTFFHLFKLKKFKLKLKIRIFEWWSGISFFHIWFVIIWTIVIGDKPQEKWKMICLSPAHSFNGGHWDRLLSLAAVTWPCSYRLLGPCCNMA